MILIFLFQMAFAQGFCPSLESVNFASEACVPTREEICHSGQPGNCEIRKTVQICKYVRGPGVQLYRNPEASRGFACVAYGPDTIGGTPESPIRIPGPCIAYTPPVCRQECKKCHMEEREESQGIKGCVKFCGEESCQDEPRCDPDPCVPGQPCNQNNTCERKRIPAPPGADFILPTNAKDKCEPNQPCPTDTSPIPPEFQGLSCSCPGAPCEFDANGNVKPCNSGPATCTPDPEILEDTSQIQNDSCPWISYEKRQPVCAPVTIGNRFPQDCCECPGSNPVNCKSCNNLPLSSCR